MQLLLLHKLWHTCICNVTSLLTVPFFWSTRIYIRKIVLINKELHYLNTVYFKSYMGEEQEHLLLHLTGSFSLGMHDVKSRFVL
jgi:hypothetical protein